VKSRRSVLASAIALVASPPFVATAQPTVTVPKIGFLVPASGIYIRTPTAIFDAFRRGLTDLGYIEGRSVRYEYRSGPNRAARDDMAAELVRLEVDVLVAAGAAAYRRKPRQPASLSFSGLAATRSRQGSSTASPVPATT